MKTSAKMRSQTPTTISVAQAKANFSALVTGVQQKRSPVTILRRGVPVAKIVPISHAAISKFGGSMEGTACVAGDIVTPYLDEWTVGNE